VSANKNVERTKMPSSRDTERQSERERERSKEGAVREKDRRRKTEMSCLYKKRLLKHGMQNVSPALPGS
jgi:hypothetical protein